MNKKAIIIVVVVIIVAVALYLYFSKKNQSPAITTTTATKTGLAGLDLGGIFGGLFGGGKGNTALAPTQQTPADVSHAAAGASTLSDDQAKQNAATMFNMFGG